MFEPIAVIKESDEDYFKNPAISNSDLTYFHNNGFANFWNYKYGEKPRLNTEQLILGSYIHTLILEPEKIDDKYSILKGSKPKSPNQELFCNKIAEGIDIEEAYLTSYKQDKKTLGSKAIDLYKELSSFIEFLNSGKIPIDNEQYNIGLKLLNSYNKVKDFIKTPAPEDYFVEMLNPFEECEISYYAKYKNKLLLKGKIDKKIRFEGKTIIVDLKTTSNAGFISFSNSMSKYDYFRQMCFYKNLVESFDENVTNIYIIALQTVAPYQAQIYEIHLDDYILKDIEKDLDKLLPYQDEPNKLLDAEQRIIPIYTPRNESRKNTI